MLNEQPFVHLLDAIRQMAERRELDPLLRDAMGFALDLFDAEFGYLILLDELGQMEFRVRQDRQGDAIRQPDTQISHTILTTVIQKSKPLLLINALEDSDVGGADSVNMLGIRSVMCTPLIAHGSLLGAIYIENRSHENMFEEEDLPPLQYFAAQAAVSIQNAILNEELEKQVLERTNKLQELNHRLQNEIHEHVRTTNELRRISIAVEQSPNSILILDTDGNIEYVNQAFTRATGYTLSDVLGQRPPLLDSDQSPTKIHPDLLAKLRQNQVWRGEFINHKKDGTAYWEYAVVAPARDTHGEISHYIAICEDISERKLAEEELKRLATTDLLTGIYNRRHFFVLADRIFERHLTSVTELAVLMIDIDFFKRFNDIYGHLVGDEILRTVAQRLAKNLRPTDLLGRYGGEEFVALLTDISQQQVVDIAERLSESVRDAPAEHCGEGQTLSISIGIAYLEPWMTSLDKLLSHADKALYAAKRAGRNRVVVWNTNINGDA